MTSHQEKRILIDIAGARIDFENRVAAVESFRKALRLKADIVAGGFAEANLPPGVMRARRRELEISIQYLARMESSVLEAADRLADAERAWTEAGKTRTAKSSGTAGLSRIAWRNRG